MKTYGRLLAYVHQTRAAVCERHAAAFARQGETGGDAEFRQEGVDMARTYAMLAQGHMERAMAYRMAAKLSTR